jgi:hypothetical protein
MSGMSIGSLTNNLPSVQNDYQKFRQEFKQLGHDLRTGDLAGAQADFVTLQQLRGPSPMTPSSTGKHPIMDGYNQLAQDLESGNIPAAQLDYKNIQQAYQNLAAHRHHPQSDSEGGGNAVAQLLNQLG